MNAIFAVAFLAACVGAQTFDRTTDYNKYLLKSNGEQQLSLTDLLRSRVNSPWTMPTYYNNKVDTTIYTLDEIVKHPLFQQYMSMPLFRQHLTNPLFQYYLSTPLFQQYWTIPQFTTFFQNPYLFYKYVYPVVYHTEVLPTTSTTSSMYDNVNMFPTVDRFMTNEESTALPQYMKNVLPIETMDQYKNFPINSMMFGQQVPIINRNHVQYATVMDKIFKNFLINKPMTEVVTDVRIFGDKKVEDKYNVDPITTIENYKVIDGKMIPMMSDRKMIINDIMARRPIDRTMINDLLVRPTMIDQILRKPIDRSTMMTTDDIMMRRPTMMDQLLRKPTTMDQSTMINELLMGERQLPIEKFNQFNTIEGLTSEPITMMNMKDALLKRMYLNKIMYGDRQTETMVPENMMTMNTNTNTEMNSIPIMERIEKLNKMHRFENIVGQMNGMDKLEKMNMYPKMINSFDDEMMTRTPVSSDLLRQYNKDLLTHIPLTKEIKEFSPMTMTMQDKILADKIMSMKYEVPTTTKDFNNINFDKFTPKTVIA